MKPARKKLVETKVVITEDIEVIEYAPQEFSDLRVRDGYTLDALRESFGQQTHK